MPIDDDAHNRFCRLEDQHKQIANRLQNMDDRHHQVDKALIDIAKSLGKLEVIADDIKYFKPKIDKVDALEARIIILEGKKAAWNERFFRVGFYILSSIVMFLLYKNGIVTATINNSSG